MWYDPGLDLIVARAATMTDFALVPSSGIICAMLTD